MTRAAAVEQLETATPTATPEAERAAGSAVAPGALPEARADELAATLDAIRADARRDPQGYLARTVVREGGE